MGAMDPQSLKDDIETGVYFVEARKWYNDIFLFPMRYNALMFVIAISAGSLTLFVSSTIYGLFPLVQQTQIIVPLQNTIDYAPVVKDISQPGHSTEEVILAYLAEKYVIAREVYDPATFRNHYYFIMRSSNKDIFNKYYADISNTSDPNNPNTLYNNGLRNKINFVSYIYDASNHFIAVNFVKQTYNSNTGETTEQKLQAIMGFTTSDYDFSVSENTRFNFTVTNYAITQIGN